VPVPFTLPQNATDCRSHCRQGPRYTIQTSMNPQNRDNTARLNLKRLVSVRSFAIAGEMVVCIAAVWWLDMVLPLTILLTLIGLHILINLLTWLRMRWPRPVSTLEFLIQLALDAGVLTALLYFGGGAANPFVSLLLLPLVVAAAILPKPYVWLMAALVVLAYGLLMIEYHPMPMAHMGSGNEFSLHVTGMWFGFLLSVAMVVFFVVRLAESLRERDRVLAEARERALRDEQLVALGTLAAGAAHELGTPLSTMAVLSKELEEEYSNDDVLRQRLTLLRGQVDRCKQTLSMISASSGQLRAESGGRVRLDAFLADAVADWRAMRPRATLEYSAEGCEPAPLIISEQGLRQSLVSFLDNAADSSPDAIEMHCRWNETELEVEICDRGAGLPQEFRNQIGKVPFSTKAEGHGLGLLLAHAIIQRLGGEVEVAARDGGGTCVSVKVKLDGLLLDE
jgi:two-component system sensor histidine kinase RegB